MRLRAALRRLALAAGALLWASQPGAAQDAGEEVVLGLSRDTVSITASFDGSEILIFGAVKREAPIPPGPPMQVIVTVAGPSQPLTVRRKERVLGIWMNTAAVEIDAAPSFYAVATSAPWTEVISNTEDLRHRISVPRAIRRVGARLEGAQQFTEALIRLRTRNRLYRLAENSVSFDQQTLFRTAVDLPANLTEGSYVTRIFLTRSGRVVSQVETAIHVQKVGLERFLFILSRERPLVYGLLSLVIAVAGGWAASAAFRALRA